MTTSTAHSSAAAETVQSVSGNHRRPVVATYRRGSAPIGRCTMPVTRYGPASTSMGWRRRLTRCGDTGRGAGATAITSSRLSSSQSVALPSVSVATLIRSASLRPSLIRPCCFGIQPSTTPSTRNTAMGSRSPPADGSAPRPVNGRWLHDYGFKLGCPARLHQPGRLRKGVDCSGSGGAGTRPLTARWR